MADKEKLIEVVGSFKFPIESGGCAIGEYIVPYSIQEPLVDHLIASGVVVSKMETTTDKDTNVPSNWIPVTERLPTIEDATEKGAILAWEVSVKHWDIWAWDCVRDYPDRFVGWMPLPEPAEGE